MTPGRPCARCRCRPTCRRPASRSRSRASRQRCRREARRGRHDGHMTRRLVISSVIASLSALAIACARAPASTSAWPADRATPRTDSNSMLAHRQLLAKRTQGTIDVYFMGNSITRRWGATDYPELLANWRQNFTGWNAADFGWGADRIEHMLWRIEHGELDGVNPKVIVILAGTNNVGRMPGDDAKVLGIERGLRALVALCRRKAPS